MNQLPPLTIPKTRKESYQKLIERLNRPDVLPITPELDRQQWRRVLIVETKGKPKRETYFRSYTAIVDFGSVSLKMCELWVRPGTVRDLDGSPADMPSKNPIRVKYSRGLIYALK